MKALYFILLYSLLVALAGCSTNNPVSANLGLKPSAAKSEYLQTVGGGFVLTKGQEGAAGICKYALVIAPARPLSAPLYLRTKFENPQNSSESYVMDSELAQNARTTTLESPPVRGLYPYCSYKVETLIYDSPERIRQIGKHIQWVQWACLAPY